MSSWDCKFAFFCIIFAFFSLFSPKCAYSDDFGRIKDFFVRIMLEKPSEYYIPRFLSIEKIAMKGVFDAQTKSWIPAILAIDFADSAFSSAQTAFSEVFENETEKNASPERFFYDKNERLRLFLFDSVSENTDSEAKNGVIEEFSMDSSGKILQSMNDSEIFRTEYDDFMRISRKIRWNIQKSPRNPELSSVIQFEYASDSAHFPMMKVERLPQKKMTKKTFFGENEQPSRYSESENGEKTFEISWNYDRENRVISEIKTKYTDGVALSSRRDFEYTKRSAEPNVKVWENGVLRLVTDYAADDVWTTTTYFDGGYAVSAHFSHGRKEIETVYVNDRVVRRRRF